jgi:hypothetical protein
MKRILVLVLSFIFVLGALLPAVAAEGGESLPPANETPDNATAAPDETVGDVTTPDGEVSDFEDGVVTMPPVDETPAPATTAPTTTAAAQDAITIGDVLPWIITALTTLIAAMIFYVIYLRGKNASRF